MRFAFIQIVSKFFKNNAASVNDSESTEPIILDSAELAEEKHEDECITFMRRNKELTGRNEKKYTDEEAQLYADIVLRACKSLVVEGEDDVNILVYSYTCTSVLYDRQYISICVKIQPFH